ncbi:type VI secretion system Vgr family protein [Chryseobacterium vrystaatense]|nr:phage baseplate assembly protein V [Chryseobacterium vrystaatense]
MMNKNISNSEKISEHHIPGINRVVKLDIIIEGRIIRHFKHLSLRQSIKSHHHFDLSLAHDTLEEIQNHNLEEAMKFLGKRLTLVFTYKDMENSPERTFVGLITHVEFSQKKMSLGDIVLKGESPTILMDSAIHTQSFGGSQPVNTSIIAERIIRETLDAGKFDYIINSGNNSYINYSTQYKETHYNYLSRLAETYGEQLYYDGETLHFGKIPPPEQSIRLVSGSHVSDITVQLKAVHIKPEFFGYNPAKNEKFSSSTADIRHQGYLAAKAYELNGTIYKTRSLNPSPINANTFLDVDEVQKSAAGSAAVEVFKVSGNTSIPFLYPGCTADLEMKKPDSSETSYFTRLMITEISHELDTNGIYTGSFEAVAEGTGYLPAPKFKTPKAEPQIATVVSNADPLNQGRIQVKFGWQLNDTTHFIRMMSPDAGGTGAVPQNRGWVSIPEVGDQVMIGFEYHHPDFPFAMGAMFPGDLAVGGGIDNQIKSRQTRSGIKSIFNDGEGSALLEDSNGSSCFMDGKGSVKVTAPKDIILHAGGNIIISAGQDVSILAGNHMNTSATMNYTQTVGVHYINTVAGNASYLISGKLTELIEGDVRSETKKGKTVVNNDEGIETFSNSSITRHAQNEIQNNSAEKSKFH